MEDYNETHRSRKQNEHIDEHTYNKVVLLVIIGLFFILLAYFYVSFLKVDRAGTGALQNTNENQQGATEDSQGILVKGSIARIDSAAREVSIQVDDASSEQIFSITAQTKILRHFNSEENKVTEENIENLSLGEATEVLYAHEDDEPTALFIRVFDTRTFEEYRLEAKILQLLPTSLLDVLEDTINVKLPDPVVDIDIRPYPTSTVFNISSETRTWYVQDASRAHIRHTWGTASLDDLNRESKIMLELDGRYVPNIVILPEQATN